MINRVAEQIPEAGNGALRHRRRRGITYFRGVDGLRGIAITSVLFFHSGIVDNGIFGVDVFFVVSGFFTTYLLMKDFGSGRPRAIRYFYGRRIKRVYPSLALVLSTFLVLAYLWADSASLDRYAKTSLASVAQVANWFQLYTNQGYWDATGIINPLGQVWSLSITEQFYLVWPVGIFLLWRAFRGRVTPILFAVALIAAAASFVAPALFNGSNADRLYLGSDSRSVAFLMGAVAALVVTFFTSKPKSLSSSAGLVARIILECIAVLALVSLITMSVSIESYRDSWIYEGGLAAVAAAAAVLTITSCVPQLLLTRFLSLGPFVSLGNLSWALFLLHLPVYWTLRVVSDESLGSWTLFLVGAPVSFFLAIFLHYLFSEPIRQRVWTWKGGTVGIAICVVVVIASAYGLPYLRQQYPKGLFIGEADAQQGSVEEAIADPRDESLQVRANADGSLPSVVTVGDSLAVDFATSLKTFGNLQVSVADTAWGGCGLLDPTGARIANGYSIDEQPIRDLCWPWKEKLSSALESAPEFVLVHNGWDSVEQKIDGRWERPCQPGWRDRYDEKMQELISLVSSRSPTTTILVSTEREDSLLVDDAAVVSCFNDAVRETVSANPSLTTLLDWNDHLCPEGTCQLTTPSGEGIFSDGVHLTASGFDWVAPWLLNELAKVQVHGVPK